MPSNKIRKVEVPSDPCPDCGTLMEEIEVMGQGKLSWLPAPANWKDLMFKRRSLVRGRICPTCGRIQLYGDLPTAAEKSPWAKESEGAADASELRESEGLA